MQISNSNLWCILFRFLRINLPAGGHPTAVAFADEASSVVVACDAFSGSSLYMYGEEKTAATDSKQAKLPLPEIKWEQHKVHDKRAILTVVGTKATYGSADGSTIIVSCSEGKTRVKTQWISWFLIIVKASWFHICCWRMHDYENAVMYHIDFWIL